MTLGVVGQMVIWFFLSGLLVTSIVGIYIFRANRDKPMSRIVYYFSIMLFVAVIWTALSLIAGHPVELG